MDGFFFANSWRNYTQPIFGNLLIEIGKSFQFPSCQPVEFVQKLIYYTFKLGFCRSYQSFPGLLTTVLVIKYYLQLVTTINSGINNYVPKNMFIAEIWP